jgi:uncharacterized protein DUF1918
MQAQPGDWLIVKSRNDTTHSRRALVLAVQGSSGEPPYSVRWVDTDREGLVFPGPDAVVVTREQQELRDRIADERMAHLDVPRNHH